jgi:glycosyltransferase involved in cell wall biosynthesis
MRVGLNLVFLVPGHTGGMETYARELIRGLHEVAPQIELTAFVSHEGAAANGEPWLELCEPVTVPVNSASRIGWVRGEQLHLPGLARRAGVDLVHSLATTGPGRGRFRRVATVHDLIYKVHPEAHFGLISMGMAVLVPLSVKRATRVIAVSQSTSDDLVQHLHVPPQRIDVVPNGVGTPPTGVALSEDELRGRLGLGERPIVLCTSAKRPHKNLLRLLDALARIPAERRPLTVLTGYPTQHEQELHERASQLGITGDVRILGWVPQEELEGLYAAATALVFPSLYEGFGLPVLEAMARGLPVASSDRSSLPEVAGDAALLFDPEDVGAMTAAIERLLADPAERERLSRLGREQAARFTWEACARATVATYERALGAGLLGVDSELPVLRARR